MTQVEDLFKKLPQTANVALLCTILSPDLGACTKRIMMQPPVCILVQRDELIGDVHQFFIEVDKEDYKFDTFVDLMSTIGNHQTIVFCNTKRKVEWLSNKLKRFNNVVYFEAEQNLEEARNNFYSGAKPYLLTTDTLPYAIDSSKVHVVLNYDFPSRDNYILRAGKSSLKGKKGIVINFMKKEDISQKHVIEQFYAILIDELPADYDRCITTLLNKTL